MSEKNIPTKEQRKAEELIDRFGRGTNPSGAIVCAEICAKEILEVVCDCSSSTEPLRFWKKVLEEIQTY